MTGQTPTDPISLDAAIRSAVHQDILECVLDYLAQRQHRTIADHVGPIVERIIAEAFGASTPDDCALKPREAYLDVEVEDEGPPGPRFGLADAARYIVSLSNPPKIPEGCERCGYPGEMLDVGICTECGTGSYAHTDACPVGQAIERAEKRLAEEIDESMCGECGRGDYDHRPSCPVGQAIARAELKARDAAMDAVDEKIRQEAEDRLSRQAQALPKNKPRLWGGVDLPEAESEMEPEEAATMPHITAEMIGREWTGKASHVGRPLMREADGDVDRRYKAGLMRADPTADAALGAPPTPTAADEAAHDDGLPDAEAIHALGEDRADELARAVYVVTSAGEPMTTAALRAELDIPEADWVAIRPHLARRVKVDTAYNYQGRRGKHTLWSAPGGGAR